MKVLVTGAAGFIGYHVSRRLAAGGGAGVLGIDNLNDYYSVALKRARLAQLAAHGAFRFVQADFSDAAAYGRIHADFRPDYVVHLGAQAGVRHSIEQPAAYVQSNITGFLNVLEAARAHPPRHLVYASSSSVYGAGARIPFSEDQAADRPLSFYGATKRADELIAHSYAHLHGLSLTGLRFFTVYGPWGRPDMAPVIFAQAIAGGKPLRLFDAGRPLRDFTYIDDIVDGVIKVLFHHPFAGKPEAGGGATATAGAAAVVATAATAPAAAAPSRIFNLGHNRPVEIRRFVQMLEKLLGKKARVELLPPRPGELPATCASLERIRAAVGFEPATPLEDGLARFVEWFKAYYGK
ncbi:MAG: NAD-dependent epimerase/dehydratase family protein [Opitutaceae bacterium]|jgi:UDP-glucuronate 4-epimerase|nr:NAD-dependent epimerase/dehydratase family protein [Opitutaceae bacterium]